MTAIDTFKHHASKIVGSNGIVDEKGELEPYLVDFWHQNRGEGSLVVRPASTEQVSKIIQLAADQRMAIVPQGGNTGLVRGGIPDQTGNQVILSLARMNKIRHIDQRGDHLIAEAGCVLSEIQTAASDVDRLFPLSLGSEGSCRIGGNISTNAGGVNVLRYGMARQLVLGLEVVLGDGRIWNGLRALRKDNTGYDLKQLFIGAEGSLGVITAATLALSPKPREIQTVWLGIDSPEIAIELFRQTQSFFGDTISSFELITGVGVDAAAKFLPGVRAPLTDHHAWHLLIEVAWSFDEGLSERLEALLTEFFEHELIADGTIAQNEEQRATFWRIREGQSEATRNLGYVIRSDISVQPGDIPNLIAEAEEHFGAMNEEVILVPFGHIGDGNLHFNFLVPDEPHRIEEIRRRLLGDLVNMVASRAGSFSAEHGIGRMKTKELRQWREPVEIEMMARLKTALDPLNILNPGVIIET